MEADFNWGIIGTGGIANAFANDLKYLDNHYVKAVASRTKNNAIKFSSNF
jgi:predicted dehydrogenase